MNFPQYTLETELGPLTYGYKREFRKWGFTVDKRTAIIPCHGKEQGHKVARIIAGSVKRAGVLVDGMARSNIEKILAA